MSKFHYGVAATAIACAIGLAGAASAQDYDRLVVFGDSLSDSGNLATLTSGAQPPAPFYPTGRFSNGPVFTELLGFDAQLFGFNIVPAFPTTVDLDGNVNLAYGGAVTGRETRPGAPPGITDQLDAYLGRGGTFGSGDLVSVLGGANNIFQAFPVAALNPTTAAAVMQGVARNAATELTAVTGRIAAAGAGTVLVTNLPNLGSTPQFSPAAVGAAGSSLAGLTTTTFNSALLAGAQTVAAGTDANIIYMDLFSASAAFNANPGAFGIANATTPCFNQTTLTVCSNPDDFLYYDSVHPTAAGHRIIAALADDYLYYGDAGAQSAVMGETAFRHREDSLDASVERLSQHAAWSAGTSVSMSASYDVADTDARGVVGAAEAESYSARVALESGPSSALRFGIGGSITQAEVEAGAMAFDLESFGFDAWGGLRSASGLFVNAAAGVAVDNYDGFTRQTTLDPIVHTGATDGMSTGAKLQLGTWFDMGGLALSPRAALSWISADVDGFFETGAAARYEYADRTVEAFSGEVALRLEAGMSESLGFYAEGGYRDALDDSSDPVIVGLVNNSATPLATEIEDALGDQFLLNAGIEGRVFERLRVSIGYRGRFGDLIETHSGGINLTLPLN